MGYERGHEQGSFHGMERATVLTPWAKHNVSPGPEGNGLGLVPSRNSQSARVHRNPNVDSTEQRRMCSAVNTCARPMSSKPIRSTQSATPASQRAPTLSDIIAESIEGQPAEVQDLLSPLSQRTGPALIRGLKQQAVRVTRERDALAQELDKVRRGSRATRVLELEMEVRVYREQLSQAAQVQEAVILKMEASEVRANDAEKRSQAMTAALRAYLKTGDISAPLTAQAPSKSLSGRSKARTLSALRSAHDTMIGQAAQLRRAFGGTRLRSVDEVATAASVNPEVSGAGEVLRYLLVHLSGLAAELRQLPGASEVMRGPALYPAPSHQGSSAGGVSSSADIDPRGVRQGGAGAGSGEKRYVYPFPGPLPRQVSCSGDLVLALMDQLHDLKLLSKSVRVPAVHPMFLHDMETVASLSVELSRELMRLKGSRSSGAAQSQQQRGSWPRDGASVSTLPSATSLGTLGEQGAEWTAEAGPCCDAERLDSQEPGPQEEYEQWARKLRVSDAAGEFDEEDVNN